MSFKYSVDAGLVCESVKPPSDLSELVVLWQMNGINGASLDNLLSQNSWGPQWRSFCLDFLGGKSELELARLYLGGDDQKGAVMTHLNNIFNSITSVGS